jgi:hypothetical protein
LGNPLAESWLSSESFVVVENGMPDRFVAKQIYSERLPDYGLHKYARSIEREVEFDAVSGLLRKCVIRLVDGTEGGQPLFECIVKP